MKFSPWTEAMPPLVTRTVPTFINKNDRKKTDDSLTTMTFFSNRAAKLREKVIVLISEIQ